jgi:hypothetical protein
MNFIIAIILPTIIILSAFYMDKVRLNKKKHIALGIIVVSTILLGIGNLHQQNKAEKREMHIDSLRVLSDTNLAIAKRDISELKVKFADCDTSKMNTDSLLKKPFTITNITTNNNSNEPELTAKELKSAFDSIIKYSPKSKCYSFYISSSSNGGKVKAQLQKLLKERGYQYGGGGPWIRETTSGLSYIEEGDCVGIVIDRF